MLKMLCNIVFKCISKLTQCLAGFWLPFPLNSLVFGPLSKCLAIDLSLAEHRLRHYNTFQSIFIRKLATPRTIDHSSAFVSPADGTIAAISNIKTQPNLVIKNQDYTIQSVLTNKPIPSEGSATLIYLAPHNIHRFVMPKTAVVKTITHVPGALYPVNPSMLKPFGHVFAENERVILTCESNNVPWYFVAIAALNVGQIKLPWPYKKNAETSLNIELKQGEECGYFMMGSSILLVTDQRLIEVCKKQVGETCNYGETLYA